MFHKCNKMPYGAVVEPEKVKYSDGSTSTVWDLCGVSKPPIRIIYCPYCGKDLNDPLDKGKWTPPKTVEAQ